MTIENECLLYDVKKPYQYIGGEYLSYNKDFNSVKVKLALAFPDKYEIAISNLGQKILYDVVNRHETFLADRVYAPEIDYRELLIKNNLPLRALESKKVLKDFDVIGFSLQYELAFPTVLEMIRLSNIAVLREERKENDPIILAGGPSCFNPKTMQDFIDIFIIGDGEEVIIEVLEKISDLKDKNRKRNEIIKKLTEIEGVYSPLNPKKTKKRIYDISKDSNIQRAPVPYSSSVQDRTVIEIRRGCGRMCRFCQAGHITLPVRERKANDIIEMVKSSISLSGYNEYSLLSLSSNDYSNIESIIENLSRDMNKKRISVSLPSQRIDRYSTKLAELVRGVRATTTTLAPEAGSQRLRNVINKNITEEQIVETILNCYKTGVSNIKLYFMIGLPTETYNDIDEMVRLFKTLRYKSKQIKKEEGLQNGLNITCTLSIFVPKPFTPFQWFSQNSQETIREKIKYLLEQTKSIKGLKINYHSSFTSKVECALSRGDEKYNKYILELHKKGAYLTTWDENVDKNLWEETAKELGFNIDIEAQREYKTEEELPWDIIDIGIDKKWLIEQYNNAINEKNIVPCEFNCVNCGVCRNLNTHKIIDKPFIKSNPVSHSTASSTEQIPYSLFKVTTPKFRDKRKICEGCERNLLGQTSITEQEENKETRSAKKYRLKLTKENEMKYISHLDWQNTITKMLYRSGLDLCYSQGFNPTPKFSLGIALPLFVESTCELIDIEIYNDIKEDELVKKLNNVLPENIKVIQAKQIDKTTTAIDIEAQWALYSFEPLNQSILQNKDLLYIKNRISSSKEIIIEKVNKKGVKKLVDIAPSIKSAEVSENRLYLILKTGQTQKDEQIQPVKPEEVIRFFEQNTKFRIIRNAFYDKNMNKL